MRDHSALFLVKSNNLDGNNYKEKKNIHSLSVVTLMIWMWVQIHHSLPFHMNPIRLLCVEFALQKHFQH